jgi:hypothetical protein
MDSSLLNNSMLSGEEHKAKQLMLLRDALMNDPRDAAAWFQLALLIGDPEREIYCLEQVLKIDPGHAGAQDRLRAMFQVTSDTGMFPSQAGAWHESRCPFVGLEQDPQSLTSYPSSRNFCYRLRQPKSVRLEYQQQYCLSSAYQRCLLYKRGEQINGKGANG